MVSALRPSDELKAGIVNDFLYDNFYSKFTTNYTYYTDKPTQISGIDTTFDYLGNHYKCDEKAAVNWCNVRLQTYAFELCSINRRDDIQLGWFLDDTKETDSYMLIWLNETDNKELRSKDEIRELDMMVIRKGRLRGYLESIGYGKDEMLENARKLRYEMTGDRIDDKERGIQFRISRQLVETPVNIRLKKDVLWGLADCYYTFIQKKQDATSC